MRESGSPTSKRSKDTTLFRSSDRAERWKDRCHRLKRRHESSDRELAEDFSCRFHAGIWVANFKEIERHDALPIFRPRRTVERPVPPPKATTRIERPRACGGFFMQISCGNLGRQLQRDRKTRRSSDLQTAQNGGKTGATA